MKTLGIRRERGMSLMEILVVAAIIGVLAVLAAGSLGRMRATGQQTASLANMRSIYEGFVLYGTENGGLWPRHSQSYAQPDYENTNGSWVPCGKASEAAGSSGRKAVAEFDVRKGAIFPYLEKAEVFVHPADRAKGLKLSYTLAAPSTLAPVGIAPPPGTGKGQVLRPLGFSKPAGVIFLVEQQGADDAWFVPPPMGQEGVPPTAVNGRINVLMADGSGRQIAVNSQEYLGKSLWYPEGSTAAGAPR
jgi:prepilin-type N-terminal cleavage/methylation domain-containing protein/prepilin-type processing-associated H-X9-DG protein